MMYDVLECSSKGDKRFSAFYAYVTFNGVYDSIEHHYQSCKYNELGKPCRKGEHVSYITLNGVKYTANLLTPFYRYLWYTYLREHKDLIDYACKFKSFNDCFRGKSVNCQADCVEAFVKKDKEFYKCILQIKNLVKEMK